MTTKKEEERTVPQAPKHVVLGGQAVVTPKADLWLNQYGAAVEAPKIDKATVVETAECYANSRSILIYLDDKPFVLGVEASLALTNQLRSLQTNLNR